MIPRPDATTATNPVTSPVSAAAEDGHDHLATADAMTRESVLLKSVVTITEATEDRQTVVTISAKNATIVVTSEEPKKGPAAVMPALVETAVTIAPHAETDAMTESNAAEAPSKKEVVTRRRDPTLHTAGATTEIQVINKYKSWLLPSQSDAHQTIPCPNFCFYRIPSPRRCRKGLKRPIRQGAPQRRARAGA